MPRNFCCNPFGKHKRQQTKDLRPVTFQAVSTGLVQEGDYLCSTCCKLVLAKLNPKDEGSDQEQATVVEDHQSPSCHQENLEATLPSTSGIATTFDDSTSASSASSTSTTDASDDDDEDKKSHVRSVLDGTFSALGESPIKLAHLKRSERVNKIRKKMRVVKESLEVSYATQLPEGGATDVMERFVKTCAPLIPFQVFSYLIAGSPYLITSFNLSCIYCYYRD